MEQCCASKVAILGRENSRGAQRRDAAVPCRADPPCGMSKAKALVEKFENERENPANFQNSASYRFEFPWALL